MLALMEGRLGEAEQLILETLALGQRSESWNALVTQRVALFVLRREQGRLGELQGTIAKSVHEYPALLRFRCALGTSPRRPRPRARGSGGLRSPWCRGPGPGVRRRGVGLQREPACQPVRVPGRRGRRGEALRPAAALRPRICSGSGRGRLRRGGTGSGSPRHHPRAASKTRRGTSASPSRSNGGWPRAPGLPMRRGTTADAARTRGSPRRGACPGADLTLRSRHFASSGWTIGRSARGLRRHPAEPQTDDASTPASGRRRLPAEGRGHTSIRGKRWGALNPLEAARPPLATSPNPSPMGRLTDLGSALASPRRRQSRASPVRPIANEYERPRRAADLVWPATPTAPRLRGPRHDRSTRPRCGLPVAEGPTCASCMSMGRRCPRRGH